MPPTEALHSHAGTDFLQEYGQFIGGTWTAGDSGKTIDLNNPTTGAVLARISAGNDKDARRAIDTAAKAFPAWSRTPPAARQEILYEIMRRLKARQHHYALMDTLNNGKPISESMHFDMPMAIEQFAIFSGTAGTVTIDTSLGAVTASGMQFASDGYTITGGALALTGAQSVIRVGDGTDAIFAANDVGAFGVIDALRHELGLRVPEDVKVVGFDDIAQAHWKSYNLTTVKVDLDERVKALVRLILMRLKNPAAPSLSETVRTKLVVRGTVG